MSFKQHLELAQSFQNEMADVDWVSVTVSVHSVKEVNCEKFVSMTASDYRHGNEKCFFQLIGDKITAKALADLKEELKGLSYEI